MQNKVVIRSIHSEGAGSPQEDHQCSYLYQQSLPHQKNHTVPPQPQQLRRLLDELRQTKLELKETHRQIEELEQRLALADEAKQSLNEQLRSWQQQGIRWRKRLRQTEELLKRVLKKYRELTRQTQEHYQAP
ncbi:MAG: hypothetical protein ACM3ZQ_08940 [Bacillota bacterium]